MARDMSDKEILKMELDQLKVELNTEREPMSKSVQAILEWVESQTPDDPLIKGVTEEQNPYKDKGGGCVIS